MRTRPPGRRRGGVAGVAPGVMAGVMAGVVPGVVLVLAVALTLVSCGSGGSGTAQHQADPGSAADFASALAVVPAGSSPVEFVDRSLLAQRLGVADVHTGASAADLARYLQATADSPAAGTDFFLPSLQTMQDAAFSELDVDWAVTGRVDGGAFGVYRLDAGVDLDALGDELVAAGFAESEVDGRRHLLALPETVDDPSTGLVAGHYPTDFLDVSLDPARHLIVLGSEAAAVFATIDGRRRSAAAAGTFSDVLPAGAGTEATPLELALLDDDPRCGSRLGNLSAVQHAEVVRDAGPLGTPDGTAYLVAERGADTIEGATLAFADATRAAADARARTAYLASARQVVSGQPLSSLGTTRVSQAGRVVRVVVAYNPPARATEVAERGDAFLLCHTTAVGTRSGSASAAR